MWYFSAAVNSNTIIFTWQNDASLGHLELADLCSTTVHLRDERFHCTGFAMSSRIAMLYDTSRNHPGLGATALQNYSDLRHQQLIPPPPSSMLRNTNGLGVDEITSWTKLPPCLILLPPLLISDDQPWEVQFYTVPTLHSLSPAPSLPPLFLFTPAQLSLCVGTLSGYLSHETGWAVDLNFGRGLDRNGKSGWMRIFVFRGRTQSIT